MTDSSDLQPTPPAHQSISERVLARRDLLHGGARVALVGGLFAYFLQQRKRALLLVDDPSCVKLETCAECIEFGGCTLPKSEDHRAHMHTGEHPKTS